MKVLPSLIIGPALFSLLMMAQATRAEQPPMGPPAAAPPPRYTLDNVVIDHFQARDATLGDVLEALGVLSYNATSHHYRPTFVVIGGTASARPVSMNISHSPLSTAIARLAEDTGLRVTQRQDSVIFSPRK